MRAALGRTAGQALLGMIVLLALLASCTGV
jgi:hypothetical protein